MRYCWKRTDDNPINVTCWIFISIYFFPMKPLLCVIGILFWILPSVSHHGKMSLHKRFEVFQFSATVISPWCCEANFWWNIVFDTNHRYHSVWYNVIHTKSPVLCLLLHGLVKGNANLNNDSIAIISNMLQQCQISTVFINMLLKISSAGWSPSGLGERRVNSG